VKRALLLAAVALVGCKKSKGDYAGLGPWKFTTTTLKQALDTRTELGPICQPTTLTDGRKATWCFSLPPIKIGKRSGEMDLYFDGTAPTAKLIEIQIKVRGCTEDEVDQWMRSNFGPPIETKSTREYWKNSFLWAAALLPEEPALCRVHFLPLSENAEIERIKQK
jgi:hypothetical protein